MDVSVSRIGAMPRLRAGHGVFAATMIALGILGLINGDFVVVWQPVPREAPAREVLVYACALVPLISGMGLFSRRIAAPAARALFAYLLVWLLVFRAPGLFRSLSIGIYWAACRTAVMAAAAWLLYAWLAAEWDKQRLGFAIGDNGVRLARALYGLAIIPFGIAHFQNIEGTAAIVPGWLPSPVAWAYFTGAAFIAAGIAILFGVYARLAAVLSAWQMGLFLALVWIPRLAAGSLNTFQRGEVITTWALTAAAWVVADSYRGSPLLERRPLDLR